MHKKTKQNKHQKGNCMNLSNKLFFYTFFFFFFLIASYCFSWPIPHSGQTDCFNDERRITCPKKGKRYYGQDAHYLINKRSYTKLENNGIALTSSASNWIMIKDNVTGLTWEVKTEDSSINDKTKKYTWFEAKTNFIQQLNKMKFGGYSDWRLPTIKELSSITNKGKYEPALDKKFFPNTKYMFYNRDDNSAFYWSSTPHANRDNVAWGVNFRSGDDETQRKSRSEYVRAVRDDL